MRVLILALLSTIAAALSFRQFGMKGSSGNARPDEPSRAPLGELVATAATAYRAASTQPERIGTVLADALTDLVAAMEELLIRLERSPAGSYRPVVRLLLPLDALVRRSVALCSDDPEMRKSAEIENAAKTIRRAAQSFRDVSEKAKADALRDLEIAIELVGDGLPVSKGPSS